MTIPEYRPPGGASRVWLEPEPESAGKDASHVSRALLTVADEKIRYERERADALGRALEDAHERERTLREHVEALTEAQSPRLEVAR